MTVETLRAWNEWQKARTRWLERPYIRTLESLAETFESYQQTVTPAFAAFLACCVKEKP